MVILVLTHPSLYVRFLLTLSLLILAVECISQKLLFHKNRYKEVFYQSGETITFRLKGNRSKISTQIKGFEGNFIVFPNLKINPDEISHLYVDPKTRTWFILRYKYKTVLPIIGFGYALLDFINTGSLSKETAVISSAFITAGLLAKTVISEKIKIKGKRKLVIISCATH